MPDSVKNEIRHIRQYLEDLDYYSRFDGFSEERLRIINCIRYRIMDLENILETEEMIRNGEIEL